MAEEGLLADGLLLIQFVSMLQAGRREADNQEKNLLLEPRSPEGWALGCAPGPLGMTFLIGGGGGVVLSC